ncbi:MAG: four-carbon acid sugar kinase family protein [Nitriliruptoraceae bacterium]
MATQTLIVLDDDPTGTQLVTDVPVLLDAFNDTARASAFASNPPAVHVVTNSRAAEPTTVTKLIRDTLNTLADVAPTNPVLLRGDSTLRAHLLEEYVGVCQARHAGTTPPLLFVPALPSAGRITKNGVHLLERDGTETPLHATEYATDGVFTYTDAHLLRYAQQRSDGFFQAQDGVTCATKDLETGGATYVCEILTRLAESHKPAVFAPDVTELLHLGIIADGLALATANGVPVVVRAAPAFAAVHAGTLAQQLIEVTPANGIIVMVGSYVPTTTRQLAHLAKTRALQVIEADVIALAADEQTAQAESMRLANAIDGALTTGGLAVVATPRTRPNETINLAAGERIATNFAATLRHVTATFDALIAKGGITSTLTAQIGLNAAHAHVVGPVITGVSQWQIKRDRLPAVAYFVVPGNVGDDACLTDLVALLDPSQTATR